MATSVSKTIPLPSGDQMPAVGFGTFTIWRHKESRIYDGVKTALSVGYRHIDCAWVYDNQEDVGKAITEKIKDGTVNRKDLFITAKVWDTQHSRGAVKASLEKTLVQLNTDYVDLYLVHWPMSWQEGGADFPKDENGKIIYANVDLVETWQGMEDCVEAGLARNIGLSNFNINQTQRILDSARLPPSNMQVEIHPLFSNKELVEFCFKNNITVTAYAPFGNPNRTWAGEGEPNVLELPALKEIADTKGKTAAQVCLRFLLQRGLAVLSRSNNPDRIKQNIEVFDFELNDDEMKKIWALDSNLRYYQEGVSTDHPEYPF